MNNRFRDVRKAKNLTLKQVGDILGISESSVSNIERGRNNPSGSTLTLFCDKLGVNRLWLETGEGEMLKPKSNADLISGLTDSPMIRAILEAYLEMTPQERKIFETFFEDVCRRYAESRPQPGDEAMSAALAGEEPRPAPPESLSG